MSFELCFRARETAAEDRCPVEGRRPLPSWADLAPACVSLPASVHVDTPREVASDLAYIYDRLGLLTSQTDLRADSLRFAESSAPTVKTYTYDGQGQLMTSDERLVSDPSVLVRRMRYDYDVLGNIVEKHTTRCVETTYPCTEQDDPTDEYYTHWFGTATYHGDQLISADGGDGNSLVATYDVAGNMETLAVTRGGQPYFTHTYTWDEQNRLASAVGTGQLFHGGQGVVAVAGYAYDNGGTRIAALRAGNSSGMEFEETLYIDPTFEIRNGEHTTYVHDSKGRLARLLPIDDNIISKITWLHADHLGSTSVVTSDDGTFIEETKYLPYGAVQSTHRPSLGLPYEPYGFTGKEPEPDFGILYFGARYYNPHLARWLSPDPLFLHVTSKSAEKDQNLYCYASNDPLNYTDLAGMLTKAAQGVMSDIFINFYNITNNGQKNISSLEKLDIIKYVNEIVGKKGIQASASDIVELSAIAVSFQMHFLQKFYIAMENRNKDKLNITINYMCVTHAIHVNTIVKKAKNSGKTITMTLAQGSAKFQHLATDGTQLKLAAYNNYGSWSKFANESPVEKTKIDWASLPIGSLVTGYNYKLGKNHMVVKVGEILEGGKVISLVTDTWAYLGKMRFWAVGASGDITVGSGDAKVVFKAITGNESLPGTSIWGSRLDIYDTYKTIPEK